MPEFQDRRCFIIGSGPSLDTLDLSALRGQLIFALNAAITLFADHLRFPDAYWVFRDRRAVAEIIPQLNGWKRMRVVTTIPSFDELQLRARRPIRAYIYSNNSILHERTVAEDALQLARRGGCSEAVLVGVDCRAPPGRPYAAALNWKPCAWYDRKNPVEESKACASFLKALRSLAVSGKLSGFPVYTTSESCDAFPYVEFSDAVTGRIAPAV